MRRVMVLLFLLLSSLTVAAAQPPDGSAALYIEKGTPMFEKKDMKKQVGSIPAGTLVRVLSQDNNLYQVQVNDATKGYIQISDIEPYSLVRPSIKTKGALPFLPYEVETTLKISYNPTTGNPTWRPRDDLFDAGELSIEESDGSIYRFFPTPVPLRSDLELSEQSKKRLRDVLIEELAKTRGTLPDKPGGIGEQ